MSNLVVDRADLWPVGTVVSAYPGTAGRGDVVTDSATVASDGTVTLTALTDGVPYVLRGNNAVELAVRKASSYAAPQTWPWKSRVAERRTAMGTS